MMTLHNPKPINKYANAVKRAAAYKVKYEACRAKFTAKQKPVYPPKGHCKVYQTRFEKYRLAASDAAAAALKDKTGLTPELEAELKKAAGGVLNLAQSAGFIPATDAEMQAAEAEESTETDETTEAPAADNTLMYAGVAAVGLLVLGAGAYFVLRKR